MHGKSKATKRGRCGIIRPNIGTKPISSLTLLCEFSITAFGSIGNSELLMCAFLL
jgi:hypothetical protein